MLSNWALFVEMKSVTGLNKVNEISNFGTNRMESSFYSYNPRTNSNHPEQQLNANSYDLICRHILVLDQKMNAMKWNVHLGILDLLGYTHKSTRFK